MLIILKTGLAEAAVEAKAKAAAQHSAFCDLWAGLTAATRPTADLREVITAINSYTQTAVREESFVRQVMPPIEFSEAEISP